MHHVPERHAERDAHEACGAMDVEPGAIQARIGGACRVEIALQIDERGLEVTDMPPIAAGDVCFHDGLTVHGAWPNESSQLRYVLALHMFADGARIREPTTASMRHQLNDFAPGLKPGDPADVPSWPLIYSADEERS